MGYAEDAMAELHGDRIIDRTPPTVQQAYDVEDRGRQIADAMGRYRGTEPLIEAVKRLASDYHAVSGRDQAFRASTLSLVQTELDRARATHPGMNGHHEGYAVILEELDELWELCKRNTHKFGSLNDRERQRALKKAAMRDEAIQIAAMAIRFIEDVCDK